jgi:hypothetical protein
MTRSKAVIACRSNIMVKQLVKWSGRMERSNLKRSNAVIACRPNKTVKQLVK